MSDPTPQSDAPRGSTLVESFGDAAGEYRAAAAAAALFDRRDRGRLVVCGRERCTWLSGLVTNAVATLDPGAGAYAFALDPRGRVRFDLNVLALPEALWLDVDRGVAPAAMQHLDRNLFSEDVQLRDASDEDARLAVYGPHSAVVAAAVGVRHFAALPALGQVALPGGELLFRHDLGDAAGFELIVPGERAALTRDRLVAAGARPAGQAALDVLRIEAGVPWLGRDIDEQVLPPETGQIERGISYVKGCYVGYEILERMRSRAALARRLVGLRAADAGHLAPGATIFQAGAVVGRVTSSRRHPLAGDGVGLGYLKTALTSFEGLTAGEPPHPIVARPLPGARHD